MPRGLEEKAEKLRAELSRMNERLTALGEQISAIRQQIEAASGRERERLLKELARAKREWDSLYRDSMDVGIRLARIEEALQKGGR